VSFALDQRLARDALVVGDMALSRVLLMDDARWPWLILVPRREGLVELTDLDAADRALLIEEAARAARFLKVHGGGLGDLGQPDSIAPRGQAS
jgi:diadenosine tetraphosphate (Ap4A) HIT family hydrolase